MRRKIKITILIFVILASQILNLGCWNYREVNEMSIVTGAAIDKGKDNGYILTVETVAPKGGEDTKMEPDIISMEGKTIFDAIRNLILRSGKKMYWSHAKVIVICEEIAKEGIVPILDFISRDAETRADIWLIVSRDKTATEILDGVDKIHDTISFHLDDMLKAEAAISKYHGIELWHFLNDLSAEGVSPTLPTTTMVDKKDERIPEIEGTAVFKKDKMIGWLDGLETRSLLLVKDELKEGLVTPIKVDDTDVSLEIFGNKTKVKPISIDDEIIMKIDIKMDAGIGEIAGTEDLISKVGRDKVKKVAEEKIKKEVEDVIKKVQKEYKSDIFGFGSIIQREMPDKWKVIKEDWDGIFSNLETEVSVEVTIKASALTSKPIKVSD